MKILNMGVEMEKQIEGLVRKWRSWSCDIRVWYGTGKG